MFNPRFVGPCPAVRLAILRIIIVAAALITVLWEDLPSFSEVPTFWYHPLGFAKFLPESIMHAFLSSWTALFIFKWTLAALLIAALVGYRTSLALWSSFFMYFIFISIPRAYAWFFHFGLTAFFLLFFLACLPCADALSLEKKLKGEKDTPKSEPHYGWSVFLLRAVVCFTYFQAGYAKLRNSGFSWMEATNLKHHIVQDSLTIMHFDFGLGVALMEMPSFIWGAMAVAAVFSELLYPIILFSKWLRWVYPMVGAALHTFILFLHNIFFPDLILIQAIFYDWDVIIGKFRRSRE